jgi:hypothetical protein
MKCEKCLYKKPYNIGTDIAFDTEFRREYDEIKDFCTHHGELCEEAYKGCEYREITVEAQDIQHVINLLKVSYYDSKLPAIEKLKEILGE